MRTRSTHRQTSPDPHFPTSPTHSCGASPRGVPASPSVSLAVHRDRLKRGCVGCSYCCRTNASRSRRECQRLDVLHVQNLSYGPPTEGDIDVIKGMEAGYQGAGWGKFEPVLATVANESKQDGSQARSHPSVESVVKFFFGLHEHDWQAHRRRIGFSKPSEWEERPVERCGGRDQESSTGTKYVAPSAQAQQLWRTRSANAPSAQSTNPNWITSAPSPTQAKRSSSARRWSPPAPLKRSKAS